MRKKKLHSTSGKVSANLLVLSILMALIVSNSVGLLAFAQTSSPVSGASVSASGNGGSGSATTDSTGFYNITTFLDTGNYSVGATATGFIDTTLQNVHVNAGAETSNVNVLMAVSGGISGRVTDAVSGLPVQSVIVQAANSTGGGSGSGSSAITNSNGNYQIITNLGNSNYVATSFAAGYVEKTVTGISVTAGVMTNNINLALDRSAVISGTITDSVNAAVLTGITIFASTPTGTFVASATTNSSGKYTLNTNLGTGTYNLTALIPANHLQKMVGGVAVVAGNQYTQNMALDPSGIISGRITNSVTGAGLANALVSATGGGFSGFAFTNATGYYRMTDGLGSASYTVFASFGGGFNTILSVSVTQGSETPNVNLALILTPSGTITGKVTNAAGSPISSASVSAIGLAGSGSTTTDSNGNYIIDTGLLTGTYNVTASKTGFVQQTQTGVSVTISQVTSNVNFTLQAIVSGRISGHVQTLGTPIPEFPTEFLTLGIFAAASIAIIAMKIKTPKLKPERRL